MLYAVQARVERTLVEDRKSRIVKDELPVFYVKADGPGMAVHAANLVVNSCGHQNAIHLVCSPVAASATEAA